MDKQEKHSPMISTSGDSSLLNRKKERTKSSSTKPKANRGNSQKASKKEYEKILKYALKLSELEYKEKTSNQDEKIDKKSIHDIEHCTIITATEEDFANPIAFFDKIWNKANSTGILKIIPPKNWRDHNLRIFQDEYLRKLKESTMKLSSRRIILNNLYKAEVSSL